MKSFFNFIVLYSSGGFGFIDPADEPCEEVPEKDAAPFTDPCDEPAADEAAIFENTCNNPENKLFTKAFESEPGASCFKATSLLIYLI